MRNRTFIAIMVLMAAVVLPGALLAHDNGKKMKRSQLPQAVQTALDTHYKDAKVKWITKTTQPTDPSAYQPGGRAAQEQSGTGGAGNPDATTGGGASSSSTTGGEGTPSSGTPMGARAQPLPGEPGGPEYLVAMELNGQQLITAFDEQGNILEEDTMVPLESTPAAVQSAFQQSPQAKMKVRNVAKITRGTEPVRYEVVAIDSGMPVHLLYDENGQLISTTRGDTKDNADKAKKNSNNSNSND